MSNYQDIIDNWKSWIDEGASLPTTVKQVNSPK